MTLSLGLTLNPVWLKFGEWRRADSRVEQMFSLPFYRELAVRADRAGIDFLFLPTASHVDTALLETTGGFSTVDSLVLAAALADATERVMLVPTVQTAFDEPYAAARRIQSLHQLSGGRAGWNVVTGIGGGENFAHTVASRPPGRHHARADEFIDVVRALWRSYPAEALVMDRVTGRYADASLVRPIDHVGESFQVDGPLNTPAFPGPDPALFSAGASPEWIASAGRTADGVYVWAPHAEAASALRASLRAAAEDAGRDPDAIRVYPGIDVCIASTREEAARIRQAGGGDGAGGKPAGPSAWRVTGTPADVADEISRWADVGAIDGAIGLPTGWTGSVLAFAEEVAPILADRGLLAH